MPTSSLDSRKGHDFGPVCRGGFFLACACSCPNTTMSTTSSSDHPDPGTRNSHHTSASLNYVVTHVFLPNQLPPKNDYSTDSNHSLARAVCAAAHAYRTHVCGISEQAQWHHIARMLENLRASIQSEHIVSDHVISQLRGMQSGGMFASSLRIPGRVNNLNI